MGDLTEEMIAAIVCKEYGWTYEQYQETPAEFIEIILLMFKAESDKNNK